MGFVLVLTPAIVKSISPRWVGSNLVSFSEWPTDPPLSFVQGPQYFYQTDVATPICPTHHYCVRDERT